MHFSEMPAPYRVSCTTHLVPLLTNSKNLNQSQMPTKAARFPLPSASERAGGWMRDGTLAAAATVPPAAKRPGLLFKRPTLPRFGAWDSESVDLAACFNDDQKKPGGSPTGTGALRDDLTAFFPPVAGVECKSATRLCLVKHSRIVSPSSALSLSCNF